MREKQKSEFCVPARNPVSVLGRFGIRFPLDHGAREEGKLILVSEYWAKA
jgi:hypothetical protein